MTTCEVLECSRPKKSGKVKFCEPHYRQALAGRPMTEPKSNMGRWAKHTPPPCGVADCAEPHSAKGYCVRHYRQLRAGVVPGTVPLKTKKADSRIRNSEGLKLCTKCAEWLPETSYYRNSKAKDRLMPNCIKCHSKTYNSAKSLASSRLNKFNLSEAEYEAKFDSQGRRCAICRSDIPKTVQTWSVDHDHACCPGEKTCGECVRGILCRGCNHGLGNFEDSITNLKAAIAYLEKYTD